jgi:hypothetical protein
VTLVCFGSVKGSPGVTLTALLTAAAWPARDSRQKVLLEADPDGGSLAARYQMPTRPGLLSLAAATGNSLSRDGIWEHAQALPGGLPAVVAPPSPDQASVAMRSVGADLGDWFSAAPIDVIADIGRISPSAPTNRFMSAADAVLVVARPTADQLQPAAARMTALAKQLPVGWVLIGDRPYSPQDVADAFEFPIVSVLPDDRRTAGRLVAGADPGKLKRSPLVREVGRFAESLTAWLSATAGEPTRSTSDAVATTTPPPPHPDTAPTSNPAAATTAQSRRRPTPAPTLPDRGPNR